MSFGNTQGAIRYVLAIDDINSICKQNQFKGDLRGLASPVRNMLSVQ